MKKLCSVVLVMVLLCSLLPGCGTSSFDADESTVYIGKMGKVFSVYVETFDQSYYDETELKEYIQDAVDAYNDEQGSKNVKITDVSVADGVGKLKMQYETAEDYTEFNGIELYQGSVLKAMAAGYDFGASFFRVEDGTMTGTANRQDILNSDDLNVVVIRANLNVKVDGTIEYVSAENVTVTGSDTVSIKEESAGDGSFETDVYTYIVYR